jgi:hypothetical protein
LKEEKNENQDRILEDISGRDSLFLDYIWHVLRGRVHYELRIEEGYFEYGNFKFENGYFEKQIGELKAKWGTKSKVVTKS